MNVLMVGVDKGRIGGMWTVAENFINSEEYNKSVKLTYIATSTGGSKVRRILKMIQGYIQIVFCLIFKKIDIVHIHMAEKGSVYRKGFVIKIAKLFHKKVVVQLHAGPIMAWYATLSEKQKRSVRTIFNLPDKMLVLGEYWKNQLKNLILEEKIEVLYNGAECPPVNPYNLNGDIILYMGLIKRTKGTFDLVDAIASINEDIPGNIKVYICGSDEDGTMPQYIKERNLNERIVLPGWITKEQRLNLFKRTIISVLPSYFEALSMTVVESMCYGIPVVTTDISTMPELLGHDVHLVKPGNVIDLAETLIFLVNNKSERIRISDIEYKRANDMFSNKKIVKRALDIYDSL